MGTTHEVITWESFFILSSGVGSGSGLDQLVCLSSVVGTLGMGHLGRWPSATTSESGSVGGAAWKHMGTMVWLGHGRVSWQGYVRILEEREIESQRWTVMGCWWWQDDQSHLPIITISIWLIYFKCTGLVSWITWITASPGLGLMHV